MKCKCGKKMKRSRVGEIGDRLLPSGKIAKVTKVWECPYCLRRAVTHK